LRARSRSRPSCRPISTSQGLTASQYLARLAAEATTVINAEDYGRTIYDLATRRSLIIIGEDMVNVAYDAPVDLAPSEQIEDAERRLYEFGRDRPLRRRLPAFRDRADHGGRHGGARLSARRQAVGPCDRACRHGPHDGRPAAFRSGDPRGPPRHGQDRARHQRRLQHRQGLARRSAARRAHRKRQRRHRRVLLARNVAPQLANRIISEQTNIPSHRILRGEIDPSDFDRIAQVAREMEAIPLYIDETGGLSIAQLAARARRLKRQRGLDLLVIDYIQLLQGSSHRAQQGRVQE
jgi:replicative DNA helicase